MSISFKKYLLLISILFFFFRVNSLGFDQTNNDSIRWFNRSEGFLEALKTFQFKDTYQTYHPGVPLMIVNAFFRQIFYTFEYSYMSEKINLMSSSVFPFLNLFSKFANVCVIYACLILQVYIIKKLWRAKTALVYFLLFSLEPYLIGIDRWFHQTSFEVTFGFTSILLILYWFKNEKQRYLLLSAFFLVLSVLTKVTSLILLPVIFYVLIKKFLINKNYSNFIYFGLMFVFSIFLIFPAMWVSPLEVSSKILNSIFNAVGDDLRKYQLTYYVTVFYYFIILAFKLSPITIILFIVTILNYKKLRTFEDTVIYLTFLTYFLFLSFSDKKIDRYSLVFFSPILLLCSHFISKLENKFIYIYSSSVFVFSLFVFIFYSPNYSAYYNPLLFGTKGALDTGIYENGGTYFYEAASYLNKIESKPSVLVPDNYEAFSMFYNGKSLRIESSNPEYVVTSLDIDRTTFNNYGCNKQVATFGPADYKVVAIFKCQ